MQPKSVLPNSLAIKRSGSALALPGGAGDDVAIKRREVLGIYRTRLRIGPSRETTLKSLQTAARILMARHWPEVKCDATGSGDVGWARIGDFPWEEVEAKHLDDIRGELQARMVEKSGQPTASTSINKHLSSVRKLLRIGFREGLIDAVVVQRIREVEGASGKRPIAGRALDDAEVGLLLAECDVGTNKGARDHAIVSVLHGAGLRRDEVGLLSIGSYDKSGKLRVLGKGGNHRVVPIPTDTAEAIDAWLAIRVRVRDADDEKWESKPLFTSLSPGTGNKVLNTRRVSSQAVFKIIKALVKMTRIKSCAPHDLRRTFASDFLDAGMDIATLQRLMGHASVATTARYDRRHERADVEAIDRLAKFRKERSAR